MTGLMDARTAGAPADTPEIVEIPERQVAVVIVDGRKDEMPRLFGEAFAVTMQAIGASGAQIAGPPIARYLGFGDRVQAEVGFPFAGTLVPGERVRVITLPGGRAVLMRHVGPYEGLAAAWQRVGTWLAEHRLTPGAPPWESYLTGPEEPGPPVTEICFSIG